MAQVKGAAPATSMQKILNVVERVGNKVPHPVIIFVILIAIVIGLVLLSQSRARYSARAARSCCVVGYCFGGPPGAGVGLVVGLVLAPLTWLLFASVDA